MGVIVPLLSLYGDTFLRKRPPRLHSMRWYYQRRGKNGRSLRRSY